MNDINLSNVFERFVYTYDGGTRDMAGEHCSSNEYVSIRHECQAHPSPAISGWNGPQRHSSAQTDTPENPRRNT